MLLAILWGLGNSHIKPSAGWYTWQQWFLDMKGDSKFPSGYNASIFTWKRGSEKEQGSVG